MKGNRLGMQPDFPRQLRQFLRDPPGAGIGPEHRKKGVQAILEGRFFDQLQARNQGRVIQRVQFQRPLEDRRRVAFGALAEINPGDFRRGRGSKRGRKRGRVDPFLQQGDALVGAVQGAEVESKPSQPGSMVVGIVVKLGFCGPKGFVQASEAVIHVAQQA